MRKIVKTPKDSWLLHAVKDTMSQIFLYAHKVHIMNINKGNMLDSKAVHLFDRIVASC